MEVRGEQVDCEIKDENSFGRTYGSPETTGHSRPLYVRFLNLFIYSYFYVFVFAPPLSFALSQAASSLPTEYRGFLLLLVLQSLALPSETPISHFLGRRCPSWGVIVYTFHMRTCCLYVYCLHPCSLHVAACMLAACMLAACTLSA